MDEAPGWSCAAVQLARTRVGGRARRTAALPPAGEAGGRSVRLSRREKVEESEAAAKHQSLTQREVGRHLWFYYGREEEEEGEAGDSEGEGCRCQRVMW